MIPGERAGRDRRWRERAVYGAWWRYRRALAALVRFTESGGHRISAAAYDRLREQARRQASS